eukprot:5989626-Karenia_brevis.AAC.1
MFMDKMFSGDNKFQKEKFEERNTIILDEKYVRRMNKFAGDTSQLRVWMFNFEVALCTVDKKVADE